MLKILILPAIFLFKLEVRLLYYMIVSSLCLQNVFALPWP